MAVAIRYSFDCYLLYVLTVKHFPSQDGQRRYDIDMSMFEEFVSYLDLGHIFTVYSDPGIRGTSFSSVHGGSTCTLLSATDTRIEIVLYSPHFSLFHNQPLISSMILLNCSLSQFFHRLDFDSVSQPVASQFRVSPCLSNLIN